MERNNKIFKRISIHAFYCMICAIGLLCTASQCSDDEPVQPEPEYKLVCVTNNVDEAIYIDYRAFTNYTWFTPAETLLANGIQGMIKIEPTENVVLKIQDKSNKTSDYCQILVIRQSTFDSHTVQDIMINNIFDKRYLFKYSEIEGDSLELIFD